MEVEKFVTKEYLNKLDDKEVKFILEHAEKQLKDTLETNLLIVNRTTTLLTITVGLMVGLVGFAVARWQKESHFDELITTATIGLLYLFLLGILLCRNIQPTTYIILGANPKDFFSDNFYCLEKDFRLICMYVNEIESYQARITANHNVNKKRWKLFNTSLWVVVATPIFLAVTFLIVSFLYAYPWCR